MANFMWGKAIHVNNCKPDGLAKDDTPVRWTDGDVADVSTTANLVWEQSGKPLRTIWLPEGHPFYAAPSHDDLKERCVALVKALSEVPSDSVLGRSGYASEARTIIAAMNPTNPDLIEARDCVAKVYEDAGRFDLAQSTRDGKQDNRLRVQSALAAFRRGRERA